MKAVGSSAADPARIRVLVVDDSALMRQLLRQLIENDPELCVVDTASDPLQAWNKIQSRTPDVLTLDVEMPKMDGLTFLDKLMRAQPLPVVMVSSLTEQGCDTTLRALELGAVDYVCKPQMDLAQGMHELAHELRQKLKVAARARVQARLRSHSAPAPRKPSVSPRGLEGARADARKVPGAKLDPSRTSPRVVAIGASTGGTEALKSVLTALPPDAPGIVIVQHMPENFTRQFANRLNGLCRIEVREAADQDRITPGLALIAPGSHHMQVEKAVGGFRVRLQAGPPIDHHRPSVDVLFESCAKTIGAQALGVILTGMGSDGARGLAAMRRSGAFTLGQDEQTCVVYGMPKEALLRGGVARQAPLGQIASLIVAHTR
ncbi:MAG TPA: chemotaxis response regulator protein-glutamate methylesterase [Polyangiaceae bacterium]|nr:chemotaxis response regulator protein-glutamate methylesterase [Polyangiaceae bacterium]